MAQSKLTSPTLYHLNPNLSSPSPSLFSQQHAQDLASQIMSELEEQVYYLDPKHKAKSLVSLPTLPTQRVADPENIRKQRFTQHLKEIKNEIQSLQKSCDKFGGGDHIKKQMDKQTVTSHERAQFYKKRIESVHGFLSLPRIPHVRGEADQDQVKVHNKISEKARSKSLKKVNEYNKWYIRPESRFTHKSNQKNMKAISVNKYIQQLLAQGNEKKEIQMSYAPTLIKHSLLKLGRQPLVCANMKISQT